MAIFLMHCRFNDSDDNEDKDKFFCGMVNWQECV